MMSQSFIVSAAGSDHKKERLYPHKFWDSQNLRKDFNLLLFLQQYLITEGGKVIITCSNKKLWLARLAPERRAPPPAC